MTELAKHLPYELTAEEFTKETIAHIEEKYGNNHHVIVAFLPLILHEAIHGAIKYGQATVEEFEAQGPAELLRAYNAGWAQAMEEKS